MEHLKDIALETRKDLDITIGAYVTLFANHLKVDIHEEMVQVNPHINLLEVIAPTSSEAANTLEDSLAKELEKEHHPTLEGEPIEEPEEDPQQANQVITRSISRAKEGREERSERRIRIKCKASHTKYQI